MYHFSPESDSDVALIMQNIHTKCKIHYWHLLFQTGTSWCITVSIHYLINKQN